MAEWGVGLDGAWHVRHVPDRFGDPIGPRFARYTRDCCLSLRGPRAMEFFSFKWVEFPPPQKKKKRERKRNQMTSVTLALVCPASGETKAQVTYLARRSVRTWRRRGRSVDARFGGAWPPRKVLVPYILWMDEVHVAPLGNHG